MEEETAFRFARGYTLAVILSLPLWWGIFQIGYSKGQEAEKKTRFTVAEPGTYRVVRIK